MQVKGSGNVFAVYAPGALAHSSDAATGFLRDESKHTCVVSLVNEHGRPCRLKLPPMAYTLMGRAGSGLMSERDGRIALANDYQPALIALDAEAESLAGLPPLPFPYHSTLLAGSERRSIEEIECYQLKY